VFLLLSACVILIKIIQLFTIIVTKINGTFGTFFIIHLTIFELSSGIFFAVNEKHYDISFKNNLLEITYTFWNFLLSIFIHFG
jgi:hypothetical protein